MNRRSILAILGASTASVAGCLSGPEQAGEDNGKGAEESDYETCHQQVIYFSRLPDEVKTEVETALEEGKYQTKNELLYDQVEGGGVEALKYESTYYESDITQSQDGYQTLSFTETTVTPDNKKHLLVQNVTEDEWNGTVIIENSDGRRLIEEEVTIESFPRDATRKRDDDEDGIDDRITKIPIDEFGRYIITFESETGEKEQVEDIISMYDFIGTLVLMDDNGIQTTGQEEGLPGVRGVVAEPEPPCTWDGKELRY